MQLASASIAYISYSESMMQSDTVTYYCLLFSFFYPELA